MNDALSSQLPFIVALQKIGWLIEPMRFFTLLGNEEFFLFLLPLVYWCFDKRIGRRLGVLVLVGDALNIILKVAFARPRPGWLTANIYPLVTETTFGLPSSHAQNAAAVWPFLALQSREKGRRIAFLGLAAVLVALVGLSRVYLGVHFPSDVVGGALIGAGFLSLFWRVVPRLESWFAIQSLTTQIVVTAVVTLLTLPALFVLGCAMGQNSSWEAPGARSFEPIVSRSGALFGLLIGLAIASRRVPFEATGTLGTKLLRCLCGFVGLFVVWGGLKAVFPAQPEFLALALRFLRYALTTLWVVCGAPWLFARLNLYSQERENESSVLN